MGNKRFTPSMFLRRMVPDEAFYGLGQHQAGVSTTQRRIGGSFAGKHQHRHSVFYFK
jgi:hypothetical protein